MEFTVEAGDLAGALSRIGRVVPSRDTLPILNAALLRVTAEHVLVTGSCMDMEATARVACEVIATGEAAVPAQIISRIVGALPKRELITVRLNDGVVNLSCKRSRYDLPTLPSADFPLMERIDAEATFRIGGDALKEGFGATSRTTMGDNQAYPWLTGIYVHLVDGRIAFASTDRHRLAELVVDCPDGGERISGALIPKQAVAQIVALAENADGPLLVKLNGSRIDVATSDTALSARLLPRDNFPIYRKLLDEAPSAVAINAGELSGAIERLSALYGEKVKSPVVTIRPSGDGVDLSAGNEAKGIGSEHVEAEVSAQDLRISVSVHQLASLVGLWPSEALLRFSRESPNGHICITSDAVPAQRQVIMPMRA